MLSLYESHEEVRQEIQRCVKSFCERVEVLSDPSKTLSVALATRLLREIGESIRHPFLRSSLCTVVQLESQTQLTVKDGCPVCCVL